MEIAFVHPSHDVDTVKEMLTQGHCSLQDLSEAMRDCEAIVETALSVQPSEVFQWASARLKRDKSFIKKHLKGRIDFLFYVEPSIIDESFVAEALNINHHLMMPFHPMINQNKATIKKLVANHPGMFHFAHQSLKEDLEFVKELMLIRADVYSHLSEEQQAIVALIDIAIEHSPLTALECMPFYLRTRERILKALKKDGRCLSQIAELAGDDDELVMAAVKQNGGALMLSSERLCNDFQTVMAAVKSNSVALRFASEELQNNREIVMAAVKQCGHALQFASLALTEDFDVVKAAIESKPTAIMWASEALQNNKVLVELVYHKSKKALKYCHPMMVEYIKSINIAVKK